MGLTAVSAVNSRGLGSSASRTGAGLANAAGVDPQLAKEMQESDHPSPYLPAHSGQEQHSAPFGRISLVYSVSAAEIV